MYFLERPQVSTSFSIEDVLLFRWHRYNTTNIIIIIWCFVFWWLMLLSINMSYENNWYATKIDHDMLHSYCIRCFYFELFQIFDSNFWWPFLSITYLNQFKFERLIDWSMTHVITHPFYYTNNNSVINLCTVLSIYHTHIITTTNNSSRDNNNNSNDDEYTSTYPSRRD